MSKKYYLKSFIISILILFFVSISFIGTLENGFAAEKDNLWLKDDSPKNTSIGDLKGYVRIASTLLIVIALIIAAAFVLKKKYGIKTNIGKGKKLITIIDHTPIGVKKSIFLVKVPGKHLLIGVTNDRINLLTEIPNENIANASNVANTANTGESFSKSEFISLMKKSYLENKQK